MERFQTSNWYVLSAGHTLIVLTKPRSPNSELYRRFWLHEHKWPLKFSDSVVESLATLGEKYTVELVEGFTDLTDCFKNDFKEPRHKYVLDFATHTRMDRYPPDVAQTCIDYLSSVAVGKPELYKIPRTTAIIMSRNPVWTSTCRAVWHRCGEPLVKIRIH